MKSQSRRQSWLPPVIAAAVLAVTAHAAPAQLQFSSADGGSSLKLGVLGQLQAQDIDSPNGSQSEKDLYFRRLRLIGQFKLGDKLSVFFDTDNPNLGKGNGDGTKNVSTSMFIQDFVVNYAFAHEFQLEGGEIFIAQSYNHNTAVGQLMPLDFGPFTFTESSAIQAINGRDFGLQTRGYLADDHLEYRFGVFQGNRGDQDVNAFRYTGRLSLWVVGAQTGLFYRGTSLGKTQSMEIGGSFDRQKDYSSYTGDFFWDQPVGNGDGVTLQCDYTHWDGGTFLTAIPKQNTLLVEAGYYLGAIRTQPFLQYSTETFAQRFDPDQKRTTFGLGHFFQGHSSDVKLAYTRLQGTGQVSRNQLQLQYQIFIW
jgi:hypothetical protein